ncbi:hypothetical protein [Actinoallomurus acaciae]|uniref:Fatty acid kinase subunit A-like C-terminal domain-containing protein n=1 Tax=Actinoallomurus acaciae TaxID=502577 RepID=A0ABV5YVC4_9ACTN
MAVIGADPTDVATRVVDRMLSGGGELVTLITGEAAGGLADAVREHLRGHRLDVEVTVYEGGQERYPLFIGVE